MKKQFTLIELIVVIVVLGILALIIMLNISDWSTEAKKSATLADERVLQEAIDRFYLDNKYYPTTNEVIDGKKVVDIDALHYDYIRNKPKTDNVFLVDENGNVTIKPIDNIVGDIEEEENSKIKQMNLGTQHGGVLLENGSFYIWGANDNGELGFGDYEYRYTPTKLTALENVEEIMIGDYYTGAITSDGSLHMWGWNGNGELGLGDTNGRTTPTKVTSLQNVIQVEAGEWQTAAVTSDGSVYVWGKGYWYHPKPTTGYIARGPVPMKVDTLTDVKEVQLGMEHALARTGDGSVYAWGFNYEKQLGLGSDDTMTGVHYPTKIPSLQNVKKIYAGSWFSGALTEDGSLFLWGKNSAGQLGLGDNVSRNTPTKVNSVADIKEVSLGFYHTAVLTNQNDIYIWGNNYSGTLGLGDDTNRNIPTKLNGIQDVKSIELGWQMSSVIKYDNSIYIWGNNNLGQLGLGLEKVDTEIYSPTILTLPE